MIKVRNSEIHLDGLGLEIWESYQDRAATAVDAGAEVILAAARSNLSRRRGTRATASPAGEPPEMDTGELARSLKLFRARKTKRSVSREYGSEHPASGLHEWGGTILQNGKRRIYPPRSYMRLAEEQVRDQVDEILRNL